MKINDKFNGDFIVSENCELSGMITGSAIIEENITFTLHGMVCQNVEIKQGAHLLCHGTVNGTVTNQRGYAEIWGVIHKDIINKGGYVFVHKDAVINGVKHIEDKEVK